MRPLSLRARGTAAALGALCATTSLAAAPAAQAAPAARAGEGVTVRVADRTLSFGQRADVRGRAAGVGAGGVVVVQQRPAGSRAWLTAGLGRTTAGGRFRVRAALRGAADVRVVAAPAASGAPVRAAAAAVGAGPVISAPTHVRVVADVVPGRRRLDIRAGGRASVRGVVRPADRRAGRRPPAPHGARLAHGRPRPDRCEGRLPPAGAPRPGAERRRPGPGRRRRGPGPGRRGRRAPERLPPRARVVVRPRLLRPAAGLRRHAPRRPARRREQVAALRHDGDAAPRRPLGPRAGHRPRALRRRAASST